ncbi:hypothetical protein [Aquiflexum sp.]|uniref:hypothetical protein n=1 Tax=Aquiflexum sp. TaxID=1872584 RepID=UPI003594924B
MKRKILFVEDLEYNKDDWANGSNENFLTDNNKIGDLKVNKVRFYEIFNIDELRKSKNKILKKYFNHADYFNNLDGYSILSNKIDGILNNYSGNASGTLLYFDFSNKRKPNNNLIKSVVVRYNKIGESFLVLSYEVQVSSVFEAIQKKIFESDNTILWEVTRFKFKFQKNGVSHSYGGKSLGSLSQVCLENLISDLSHQIANTFKSINGYFLKDIDFPCLVLFEKDGEKFNLFDFYNRKNFLNQDDIVILPNDFKNNSSNIVYYFLDLKFSDSAYNSDQIRKIEKEGIINSIGILNSINVFLDHNISDLIKKRGDLNKFLLDQSTWFYRFFPVYFYFLKLKLYSSQIKLFSERVFNDIESNMILKFHFSESIRLFNPDPNNFDQNKNLEEVFILDFKFKTKYFKKNVKLFNLVLNDFESLNNYKTSYFLQIIAILLTLLTIYFSFFGGFSPLS